MDIKTRGDRGAGDRERGVERDGAPAKQKQYLKTSNALRAVLAEDLNESMMGRIGGVEVDSHIFSTLASWCIV